MIQWFIDDEWSPNVSRKLLEKVRYKGVSEDAKPPQDSANAAAS